MSNEKMREAFEEWFFHNEFWTSDGKDMAFHVWKAATAATQRDAMAARIEELERELGEWQKLKSTDILHVNLLRGFPSQLSVDQLLHIAGDRYQGMATRIAELEKENTTALRLVAEVRFACGDDGKRMQDELVQYVGELARDAARYRWLRDVGRSNQLTVLEMRYEGEEWDEYIDDAAMEQANNREGA